MEPENKFIETPIEPIVESDIVPEDTATPEIPVSGETSEEIPLLLTPQPIETVPTPSHKMPTVPQLAIALGGLALLFIISYLPIRAAPNQITQIKSVKSIKSTELPTTPVIQSEHTAFGAVAITAKAAYVWDVKNQRALYTKNAGERLPLASLTKLMTALLAYTHLSANDRVSITRGALHQEGDSQLKSGEVFSLRALTHLTLITSSNDGAYALAAAVGASLPSQTSATGTEAFITAMNAKAEELGLSQTFFTNVTGLDVDETTSGGYGSARDMAFLMEYLMKKYPEILDGTNDIVRTILDTKGVAFRAVNTNEITKQIPGLIGSKTGFTSLAGGNLVIAYDAGLNRPIIISVLGSTREGRFADIQTLITETAHVLEKE